MPNASLFILALDLAEHRTGWIDGEAGSTPRARVLKLKQSGERTQEAIGRYACWLRDRFEERRPDLVCMEGLIPAGAMPGMTTSFTREGQVGLHYATRAVAACYGIPVRAPAMTTIRKHFVGVSTAAPKRERGHKRTAKEVSDDRAAMKAMIIRRAILLGYLPAGSVDDNAADAAAVFDFASANWGRVAPTELMMFGAD